ncbi:MAG: serine/threonine protein kinase, partial [Frankiales bacterium]|nr:serine/threonine protein kinase [Frankiales bacterium]
MDPGGRLVGERYRLLGHLGAGGMGTVWRAQDTLLGREVAVKEVTFPPGTRPEEAEVLRERTRREARSAARLSHPNAVTVFDVVEEDGRPWLVLELVEARTLAQAVAEDGPMTPARAALMGLAVLGALEAAHAEGILHRDVKPSNVLLAPAQAGQPERAVLTDFGIATNAGDPSLTSSGLLLGSPAYISPERASGKAPGPASDLWSLGATLFTAVEGRPPYDNGDPLLTVTAVIAGEHAPYALAGPLVPVLDGLLEKDPGRRLDARRAREQLQAVVDQAGAFTRTASTPAPVAGSAQGLGARTAALSLGAVREEVAEVHREQLAEEPHRARAGRRAAAAAAVVAVLAVSAGVL